MEDPQPADNAPRPPRPAIERWLALMSTQEARLLLRDAVDQYRRHPFADLRQAIGLAPVTREVFGRSGARYTIAVHVNTEDTERRVGALRVVATITGEQPSGYPLSDEFVVSR